MQIENDFNIEDIVFLKHDEEQKPRMITAIVIQKNAIMYECICAMEVSNHYSFELQKEKKVF